MNSDGLPVKIEDKPFRESFTMEFIICFPGNTSSSAGENNNNNSNNNNNNNNSDNNSGNETTYRLSPHRPTNASNVGPVPRSSSTRGKDYNTGKVIIIWNVSGIIYNLSNKSNIDMNVKLLRTKTLLEYYWSDRFKHA